MVSGYVIRPSVLDEIPPAAVSSAGRPKVLEIHIGKALRGPPQHVGLHLVQGVPTGSRPEPANPFPAGPAVNLGGPSNMKRRPPSLEPPGAVGHDVIDDPSPDA